MFGIPSIPQKIVLMGKTLQCSCRDFEPTWYPNYLIFRKKVTLGAEKSVKFPRGRAPPPHPGA